MEEVVEIHENKDREQELCKNVTPSTSTHFQPVEVTNLPVQVENLLVEVAACRVRFLTHLWKQISKLSANSI